MSNKSRSIGPIHCCSHNCKQGRDCPNRTAHGTLGNVALIAALVSLVVVLLAWAGPAIDDHSGDSATADAIEAAQARDRYLAAAQRSCGSNVGVIELEDGSMRCALHNGRKTARIAMVAP